MVSYTATVTSCEVVTVGEARQYRAVLIYTRSDTGEEAHRETVNVDATVHCTVDELAAELGRVAALTKGTLSDCDATAVEIVGRVVGA